MNSLFKQFLLCAIINIEDRVLGCLLLRSSFNFNYYTLIHSLCGITGSMPNLKDNATPLIY